MQLSSLPSKITIDGYAASGKSTAAARLAEALNYLYFDTGVMYRAVTWAVLDRNIDPSDAESVSQLAETLMIEVTSGQMDDGRLYTVWVDNQDVTWLIRSPAVDANVSRISSYPRVRSALTAQQRRIASGGSIVMAGRDIGTVVLPDADLKIFMDASAEERARRRYKDTVAKDPSANYNEILAALIKRDELDRTNPVSPTVPAKDAIIFNTDDLSLEQVVDNLIQLVMNQGNGAQ